MVLQHKKKGKDLNKDREQSDIKLSKPRLQADLKRLHKELAGWFDCIADDRARIEKKLDRIEKLFENALAPSDVIEALEFFLEKAKQAKVKDEP